MFRSVWDYFKGDINRPKCDWCKGEEDLYLLPDRDESELVCRECLVETDFNEVFDD